MLHVVVLFFCSFIISQVSTTMTITTTPPVTVVSSGMSSISSVAIAPSLMGLPATLGQHDVVLPPPLTESWSCYWPCFCVTAATSIFDASSGLCQLCHGFSTGKFLEPPTVLYIICLVSVHVSAFYFLGAILDYIFTPGDSTIWGLHHCNPLELTHGRHMCNLGMGIGPHQVCTEWLLPPLHLVGGNLLLLSQLFPSHPIYTVGLWLLVSLLAPGPWEEVFCSFPHLSMSWQWLIIPLFRRWMSCLLSGVIFWWCWFLF